MTIQELLAEWEDLTISGADDWVEVSHRRAEIERELVRRGMRRNCMD